MNINDNGTNRDMTETEIADYTVWQKEVVANKKAKVKDEANREALKQATLAKLGLTADEVAALLS